MASYVENPSHRMCGLRPRCSDFPRAEAPPHPGEADGAREVPLPGYKRKCRQYIKFRSGLGRVNSSHQRTRIENTWLETGGMVQKRVGQTAINGGAQGEARRQRRRTQWSQTEAGRKKKHTFFEQQQLTDRVCERGGGGQ